MRVGDHREGEHGAPHVGTLELGEKGLTDSGLERGGEPPLGLPLLLPSHVIQGKSQGVGADD